MKLLNMWMTFGETDEYIGCILDGSINILDELWRKRLILSRRTQGAQEMTGQWCSSRIGERNNNNEVVGDMVVELLHIVS